MSEVVRAQAVEGRERGWGKSRMCESCVSVCEVIWGEASVGEGEGELEGESGETLKSLFRQRNYRQCDRGMRLSVFKAAEAERIERSERGGACG